MATKTKLIKKGVKKLKEVQEDLFPDTLPKTPDQVKKLNKEEWKKLQENQMDMFPEDLAKKQKDAQMKKDMLGKKKRKKKTVKKAAGGPIEEFGAGGEIAKRVVKKGKEEFKEYLKKRKQKKSADKKKELLESRAYTKDAEGNVTKVTHKDSPKPPPPKKTKANLSLKEKLAAKKQRRGRQANLATIPGGKMSTRERNKVLKRMAQSGYAGGGKVKTERERAQQIVDEGYAKVKARREKAKRIAKGQIGDMKPKKYAHGGPVKKSKSIDGIAQRGLTRAKHK